MRRKMIVLGVGILTAAIVVFAACHKNSSSSSGSGSIGGAMEDLALLSLGAVNGNASFPSIGVSCTSGHGTTSGSFITNNSGTCSTGYTNPTTYSNDMSETFTGCGYGGYTFNGTLSFNPQGSGILVCQPNVPPATDIKATGNFDLVVSTTFTITGNGLNSACNAQFPMNAAVGITYIAANPTPLVGVISGPACGTTLPSLNFY